MFFTRDVYQLQVKRTLDTSQMETQMSAETVYMTYRDICQQMGTLVSHPWRGLVMAEQLFWKSVRMLHGNKRILK